MAYTGGLLYLQDIGSNPVTYTEFPIDKIRYETYSITPNQRMDLDTGLRDLTGVMHRNVVAHTASKIEFETVLMPSEEMEKLIYLLRSHFVNWLERDLYLRYFNPEGVRPQDVSANYGSDNASAYKTGHFYMPDIQFSIRNVDQDTIIDGRPGHTDRRRINYQQVRFAFIEY